MGDDREGLDTFSFRAEKEKMAHLDHLIDRKNVKLGPGADERINRSDLLRDCVDGLIDELEQELDTGNRSARATAD